MRVGLSVVAVIALHISSFTAAHAAGGATVAAIPNSVHAEGGRIYIHGDFPNPDQCTTSSVIVLTTPDARELDRMMSIALTALTAGKRVSMWLLNCTQTPWSTTAPQAVTITILR